MYDIFFQPVKSIISIKETTEKALKRLGIVCIRDLVFYKPYSYNIIDTSCDLSSLINHTIIQAEVKIDDILQSKSSRSPTKIYVSNDTGNLVLIFFNKISPFLLNKIKIGQRYVIHGKVQSFDGIFQITHPEFIFKKSLEREVEPIYHLTYGLVNKQLYDYILTVIKTLEIAIKARQVFCEFEITSSCIFNNEKDYMTSIIDEIKLLHLVNHKAKPELIQRSVDHSVHSLAEKELFANQVSLFKLKQKEQGIIGRSFKVGDSIKEVILANLGFELTSAQQEAIKEIESEQKSSFQMMRLLQGDVGSGKTLIALLTMLNVVTSGAQCVLMVPTDLLSMQHHRFFNKSLKGTGTNVRLLTGKTSNSERRDIKQNLEDGTINILIGTHALFQESVTFKDLGYVVIDEQHRFGVEQRLELIAKATHPDVLVMTATPIPRSLTLAIFGDMNISKVKTKPKNRLPIITTTISGNKRKEVILSLQKILDKDQKLYWVCPLIDRNDATLNHEEHFSYSDVITRYDELNRIYPGQIGVLHGKMKANEKDAVMQKFNDGEVKILVATTVIEVGIDVQDATLIIIEDAEKFGLAQLHQLRGRVGRGSSQSYCILIYNSRKLSLTSRKRLEIMRQSNDGFYIAEQDLILRGGGEILGVKQSGEPNFFFADLGRDLDILLRVNELAQNIQIDKFIEFQIKLFAKDRQELIQSG